MFFRVFLNPPESQLTIKKITGTLMINSALITMLTYSNADTSSALGLKKNPSNIGMVIKAKNIVVTIVTFTNLSDAMSAGEVVLDRNCILNFICFLITMMDAALKMDMNMNGSIDSKTESKIESTVT
jgi:hypothetical protein